MEPIAIAFCVFQSAWLLLCIYIIRRTYQRQVYNYQRYERNQYVEDMLTKQRVESGVQIEDLTLKELQSDDQGPPITTSIQLRFLIMRNLSKYSLASYASLHLIHKQSLFPQFLDLNLVVTLCPLITYSLLGEAIQNISIFSATAIGIGLCIFVALHIAYRHQPQFQIQNSIRKLFINLNRYSVQTPTKIERSLESEFVLEVTNQAEILSQSLSTTHSQRRKSLSMIVSVTALTSVVMYSYVDEVTSTQVFYGILYGACIQQILLTIMALLWSFYEFQRPDPTIALDLRHLIQSKPQSLVNSPTRKPQNIKDKDSPLKYLIKKEQIDGPMSKTANKSHQTSMDKKFDQSYEMNSGDNLIPQQQQQELNDFVIDEPKDMERPASVQVGTPHLTPNQNNLSPKGIGTTPEYSMKKVFSHRTQLQPLGESSSKKNVLSVYGKLPPVRKKENIPEFQIEKPVKEEKLEEILDVDAEVDKYSLQRSIPLQDVENTQFSLRHKMEVRQSVTRNSLYKTSMEMEEESFQQTRLNIKSISSSQRYEEDFPQNQTIQLSNFGMVGMMTMDPHQQMQETKRERGRSETMHVKQKRPKKQDSQSVDDPQKEQENASSDLSRKIPPPPGKRKNVKKLQQIAKIYDTTKIQISSKQRFD